MTNGAAPKDVFFLPQKPYNFLGTLRQQIMYPNIKGSLSMDNSSAYSDVINNQKEKSIGSVPFDHLGEDDSYFLQLLDQVRLGTLAAKMGDSNVTFGLNEVTKDWSKVLSLGEQQRLAFARVLYNKPSLIGSTLLFHQFIVII